MAGIDSPKALELPDYYQKLYALQDKVLTSVFAAESEFYLTGGTCLSRFYQAKRYSDDLDFFTNASPRFSFAFRNITSALHHSFTVKPEVETKNFSRLIIENCLQVDFVNDTAFRLNTPTVTEEQYLIDTIDNILANKLTAVIGRDNPKDIFDIVLIFRHYSVSWPEIVAAAHKKAGFATEDLIVRIKEFPTEMLGQLKLIDSDFLINIEQDLEAIIQALLRT